MPSTKLLKERIESIQDTMKITNAMYLISSSKLRKARKNYQNVLPCGTPSPVWSPTCRRSRCTRSSMSAMFLLPSALMLC